MNRREFLTGAAALAGGAVFAEEGGTAKGPLPPGAIGDPDDAWFGRHIFPLPHTQEDGASSSLVDGKVVLPARSVPIFHETDVVVVGGGPAGFAAAVAAAKTGAKVALVERYGSLGGLFTNGMVLLLMATARRERNGEMADVVRGVCGEFMDRAAALGPAFCSARTNANLRQPTIDPEAAKYLMDRMVEERKVDMFFHAWGVDVIQDGPSVRGVVFMSKQGFQAILAREVVDCTGDGDIFFAAGADYRQITHSIGFVARVANIDRVTEKRPPLDENGKPVNGYWPTRAIDPNGTTSWVNSLGPKGNGLDVRDLSKAEVAHRKDWWEKIAKARQHPGWKDIYLANTCSQIGPRATRLLKSGCIVDRAMLRGVWAPEDVIGWFGDYQCHPAFPVPYRSLVPDGVENLLAAGRCLGAPDTCDTFRLIGPCFVTGEAAGTAAALCAQKGVSPRDLDVTLLRKTLLAHGVWLG